MRGATTERHFVAGFEIPSHVPVWPEHEIEHGRKTPERHVIRTRRMDDFWSDADHELKLARPSPGFLEQDTDRHLCTRIRTNRRNANFQLEPVLDRRDLEGERPARMKALSR